MWTIIIIVIFIVLSMNRSLYHIICRFQSSMNLGHRCVCVCGKEKVRERVSLHVFAVDHNSWLNIKQLLIVLCESHTAAISRHCSLFKLLCVLVCFGESGCTCSLYVFCFHLTACSYLKSFHSQFNSRKPFCVLCFIPHSKDLKFPANLACSYLLRLSFMVMIFQRYIL